MFIKGHSSCSKLAALRMCSINDGHVLSQAEFEVHVIALPWLSQRWSLRDKKHFSIKRSWHRCALTLGDVDDEHHMTFASAVLPTVRAKHSGSTKLFPSPRITVGRFQVTV
jgi:hypothetical protein